MRKREVEAKLRAAGATKISEKGSHEKWGCPCGQHRAPVPRHTKISPGVIRGLSKYMPCLPEGWWK